MESKLHSDATQIEKRLRLSKLEQEIEFKLNYNKMQHQLNVKLIEELENKFSCI